MKKNSLTMKKLTASALAAILLCTAIPALPAITGSQSGANIAYADDDFQPSNVTSLSKVTGLSTIARDDDEIKLTWNSVKGASGYEVYGKEGGEWKLLDKTDDTDYDDDDDLRSATVYSFRVRAFARHDDGQVVYGPYAEYKTCTAPKEVDNLRASAKTKSTITLKWSPVKRADKYQVYLYNSASGSWKRLITTAKTTYKVKGLKSNTTYRLRVRAVKDALGYHYYSDFDSLRVRTKKSSTASTSSSMISAAKAKSIALERAGLSSSQVRFTKVELDYDDGVRIYELEFYSKNYEYEVEVSAYGGRVLSYDRESIDD